MVKTSAHSNQFQLRLPDGMKDRIAIAATQSGRSMNAWVVEAIETALRGKDEFSADILIELHQMVGRFSQDVGELKQARGKSRRSEGKSGKSTS